MKKPIKQIKFEEILAEIDSVNLKDHAKLINFGSQSYHHNLDVQCDFYIIAKNLITLNPLSEDRYGSEDSILMIGKTLIDIVLVQFFVDQVKKENPIIYLRGPSGIGKSYSLLKLVLLLKKKKHIVLHIILSPLCILKFGKYFLNDLMFSLSYFKDDQNFPSLPPEYEKKLLISQEELGKITPLQKWFIYLSSCTDTNISHLYEGFKTILALVQSYLCSIGKKIFTVVDQQNEYYATHKKNKYFEELDLKLVGGEFFNCVLISASNTNEGFRDFNSTHPPENVLNLNTNFNENHSKLLLENCLKVTNGPPLEKKDFLDIYKLTGYNALELSSFIKVANQNPNLSLTKQINLYASERSKDIYSKIVVFHENNLLKHQKFLEQTFLLNFYQYLDVEVDLLVTESKCMDKRFMYVENNKLKSISPISKKCLDSFYLLKLYDALEKNQIDWNKKYYEMFKQNPTDSLGGCLFEKIIILKFIALAHSKRPFSFDYYDLHTLSKTIQPQKLKLTSILPLNGDITKNTIYDKNYLYLPLAANHPYTDFLFMDVQSKTLYAVQVTINIFTHTNSDTLFMNNVSDEIKKQGHIDKINFIWITTAKNHSLEKLQEHFEKVGELNSNYYPKSKDSWIVFVEQNKRHLWFEEMTGDELPQVIAGDSMKVKKNLKKKN